MTEQHSRSFTLGRFLPSGRRDRALELAKEAFADFDAGESAVALGKLQKALKRLKSDDPCYIEVRLAEIACWARVDVEGTRARDEFVKLVRAQAAAVTPVEYCRVAMDFTSAGRFLLAIDILDLGRQTFPHELSIDRLGYAILSEAVRTGDRGALGALRSLGYITSFAQAG